MCLETSDGPWLACLPDDVDSLTEGDQVQSMKRQEYYSHLSDSH